MSTGPAGRVVICDDEKNMRRVLEDILADDGWEVANTASGEDLLKVIEADPQRFQAVILDLSLPGMNGLEVIDKLRAAGCDAGLVVITAYGSVEVAVQAMQRGASDFLIKPFDNARIRNALRKVRDRQPGGPPPVSESELETTQPTMLGADNLPLNIIGNDPRLGQILRMIRQIASHKTSVLIYGESGTGKELIAQAVHYNGARRNQPFVAINCAALPETLLESELFGHEKGSFTGAHATARGKFEIANNGTLFLDEVGDMPPSLQVRLLRVLQEQRFSRVGGEKEITVDVRVIAATNRNLEEAVRDKTFREDLYYRLNVIPIQLPALRERPADIPHLVEYFLGRFARRHRLERIRVAEEQMKLLQEYAWPGNIRELQNAVEKATVLQDVEALMAVARGEGQGFLPAAAAQLPAGTNGALTAAGTAVVIPGADEYLLQLGDDGSIRPLSDVAADAQRAAVIRALKICRGNKSDAAKKLGISYKTLFNKIDDLDIQISTTVT